MSFPRPPKGHVANVFVAKSSGLGGTDIDAPCARCECGFQPDDRLIVEGGVRFHSRASVCVRALRAKNETIAVELRALRAEGATVAPCVYTLEFDDDGECVGMRPECCPAEPLPFDAMEEPFCRYCGKPIECEDGETDDE